MYAKIIDNQVQQYPFGPGDLILENPLTSFPEIMSDELLANWNVYPVQELSKPSYDERTQKITIQTDPVFVDNQWQVGWDIIDKSSEEIAAYDQGVIDFIKSERNKMLFETDWMALSDNTLTEEWATYRQALRDVPQQPGFPYSITWPTKPVS